MDFALTEACGDLAGLTRKIASGRQDTLEPHGSGGFDRALWADLAKAGVLDAALPAAVGGGGFGLLEQCSVLIELGRETTAVPYLETIVAAGSALARFGTGEQREQWLIPALRGDRVLAATIPDSGSPCGFRAHRDGAGWIIDGEQTAVAAAAFAGGLLLVADTDEGRAVFLTAPQTAGLTVHRQETVDRADAALVSATAVAVDGSAQLGATDGAVAGALAASATVGLCALQLGVLERALELTAEYARERTQFDQVIGGFQAVRQRLADAYIDVEAVRLTLWQAAWRLAEDLPATAEVATAKYWAAEAGHRVGHTCVHIHGGVGIDVDAPMHRYFVAATRAEFGYGGANAQLRTLGDALAVDGV